jgi:hypothetical protein
LTKDINHLKMPAKLTFLCLLLISSLLAQDRNNYQNIKLERIPSGKIFIPRLIDTTGSMKTVLDKINGSILKEFEIDSYEDTAERPWDEIEMSIKTGNNKILVSITATLDGSVTGFGQQVSEALYFDLTNGNRINAPEFVSALSYFSTDGYLKFLKDYNIIEAYNIAVKEAIECAEGTAPNCHLHELEFRFLDDKVSVYMDQYECYPRWGYACLFSTGAELKVEDFLKYLNKETKEYFKLVSEDRTFEVLEKRGTLNAPKNLALFGKMNGKYPFSMMINVQGKNVSGHYYYNSKKELIELTGKIDNGKLILKEYVGGNHTGTFVIEKPESFNEKIYWESVDRKKRFDITVDSEYSLYDLKTN